MREPLADRRVLRSVPGGPSEPAIIGTNPRGVTASSDADAEARLRESEERFRLAFDTVSVGMYMVTYDPAHYREITQVNAALCEFLGRSGDELLGRTSDWLSDEIGEAVAEATGVYSDAADLSRWRREIPFRHADGRTVWGLLSVSVIRPIAGPPHAIALVEDITARKQAEDRLRHLALHDVLTGLPNRMLLTDRVEQALAMAERSGMRLGLLYCDLDAFKQVNDSAGHPAGDELLVQAGARLRGTVRPGDTVARIGGDEFAILCTDLHDPDELPAIAARVLAAMRTPFRLTAGTFTISASIGICGADTEVGSAEQLLHRADTAMYGAKRTGKDRFTLATADEHARAARTTELRPALETALAGNELVMYGQPLVELGTGVIGGVEMLLRWHHPEHGTLTPATFLDVAENSPLMVPIGRRVLAESCRIAARWVRLLGPRAPVVGVNVSGRELAGPQFVRHLRDILARTGLPPSKLVLELTETHLPLLVDSLRADMLALRDEGVGLVIDDLGTGYSSLARITELPVDALKIDMSFVHGLGTRPSCNAVIRAVLEIGRALNVDVVAEGVETEEQARLLRQFGCRQAQGFLFARPQPEDELIATLLASPTTAWPLTAAATPTR